MTSASLPRALPSTSELERYLEEVLRKKQAVATEHQVLATAKVQEIRNLINYLGQKLQSKATIGVRHLLDVGSEVFLESTIDDMSYVLVETVHGFYVTMLLSEAIDFLQKRLTLAEERHHIALKTVAFTKTEIKCFLEALEYQIF